MPDAIKPNKAESQVTLASSRSMPATSFNKPKGWWKGRTKTEKSLLLVVAVSFFVVVGLGIALCAVLKGYVATTPKAPLLSQHLQRIEAPVSRQNEPKHQHIKEKEKSKVCLTKGCIKAAASVLDRLDLEVNPCDDFYKFACGTYEKTTIIPDEKTAVTQFSIIQDELQEKLRLVIEEEISTNDSMSTTLVKNLYKSCMNTDRIEAQGTEPLLAVLKEMGGWPVVDGASWDPANFSWMNAIFTNREKGYSVDYLMDFSVTVDVKNSSWRIIDIDQPPLGMPSRKYLLKGLNDTDVKAYFEYQVALAVMLGAKREAALTELKDALIFEMRLANFSKDSEERRNISELYNRMTIRDLELLVPEIPFLEYANQLLPDSIKITRDEPIIVNEPDYIKSLGLLLRMTPKRVVANYLMWRIASASVGFLSDKVRDLQLRYSKQLTGKGTRAPRWKECMGAVSGSLSHAVGSLYAKKFFKENAKAEADEMVSYLRKEFDNILHSIDWMDEETRRRALIKSRAIVAHIGYPKELLIDAELDSLYKDNGGWELPTVYWEVCIRLEISDGDLLDNMRNLTTFGTDFSFGRLREKVDKQHWRNHGAAAVVNAFYSPLENSIQFPAGILQGAFFDANRPKYLNYGGIGFVIGHEITHGFDDRGRQFDENGDLQNWWDVQTQANFIDRSKCIVWQYGNYTISEVKMNVNGINTQGENIADNGGLKEAYRAYNKWVMENGKEDPLPGLEYTPNQLFWVSAAHVWCSKYRPETMKLRIITGSHSPVQFRVNGPMSNIPEFSKDWNCKLGTKMNPVKKCTVW